MRLIEAPVGLFLWNGEMCLKTEYIAGWGVEAFIVSSGETFWGGAKTSEERNNLDVTPIEAEPVRHGYWENANGRLKTYIRKCSVCGKEAYFCGRGCSYKFCPNCGAKMEGESDE